MQNCRLTAPGLGFVRGGALCQRGGGGGVPIYYLTKFPKKTALKSRELVRRWWIQAFYVGGR